jgi:hypothetical protein
MLPSYYHERYTKLHHWELQRELEKEHLADRVSPPRNVLRRTISKLGVLLIGLGSWMKRLEKVERSPKPITGNL